MTCHYTNVYDVTREIKSLTLIFQLITYAITYMKIEENNPEKTWKLISFENSSQNYCKPLKLASEIVTVIVRNSKSQLLENTLEGIRLY